MRLLGKAALLLAPALVAGRWITNNLEDQDITSTVIDVPILELAESHDDFPILSFHVNVLASDQMCGYGNITINGQELEQESFEGHTMGKGDIVVDDKVISGSWYFYCLNGWDEPHAQQLDFTIIFVDNILIEDVTFTVEFQQTQGCKILSAPVFVDNNPEEDMSNLDVPDEYSEDMDFELEIQMDFEDFNIEAEVAELRWMKGLVRELEYQIYLKEEAMAVYISEKGLEECDSLKCVFKTIFHKARTTVHMVANHVYSKFADQEASEEVKYVAYPGSVSSKPPWKKPHWRKPPFYHPPHHGNHSHHNHTCHGNHSEPHPHPPPFWRRPHHPPLCRCPQPPHHGPPHHGPPHHGPPHHGPPHHRPCPPSNDTDHRHQQPDQSPSRPQATDEDSTWSVVTPTHLPSSPDDHPQWRASRKWHKIHAILKFFFISMMLLLLVAIPHTIRKHCCTPSRRQARQARREERHRRRALRRAARRQAWKSWFQRHVLGYRSNTDNDEEEAMKRAMLAHHDSDDMVGSEISQIRNAASVVGDMVAAEEGRMSTDSRASLPDYMSQVGGERLPTYEDSDGSELSSVVADGFLYTPGSSEYTPGSRDSGTLGEWVGDGKR